MKPETLLKYPEQAELWDAINDYTTACGGRPDKHVGSIIRMNAVAAVECIVRAILSRHVEQPVETEEQAALRELGAWLAAHPGYAFSAAEGTGGWLVTLESTRTDFKDFYGLNPDRPAAIREALRLAKGDP